MKPCNENPVKDNLVGVMEVLQECVDKANELGVREAIEIVYEQLQLVHPSFQCSEEISQLLFVLKLAIRDNIELRLGVNTDPKSK